MQRVNQPNETSTSPPAILASRSSCRRPPGCLAYCARAKLSNAAREGGDFRGHPPRSAKSPAFTFTSCVFAVWEFDVAVYQEPTETVWLFFASDPASCGLAPPRLTAYSLPSIGATCPELLITCLALYAHDIGRQSVAIATAETSTVI